MKQKKEKIGVILAISSIAFGLVTFVGMDVWSQLKPAQKKEVSGNIGEPVHLSYYTWDEEEAYMRPMVESFNALNPTIQVELHVLKSDFYDGDIVDLVKKGEDIDVIGIRGISQMARYEAEGMLRDVTKDIINSDIDVTAYGNMYDNIMIDGEYYGMPTRTTCWALVYNKDIFDEMGEAYPGQMTWQTYGEVAKRLTHTREDGFQVWGSSIVSWAYNFAGIQNANYLYDDDQTYQRKSLELLNQFMNVDHSQMGLQEAKEKDEYWLTSFENGSVAMMPMGEWFVGMVMDDEKNGITDVNWDLAPMPIFEGMNPGTTWGQYQFTGITNTCDHEDAAFQFLKYVGGREGAQIYAEYGMLSAYSSDEIKQIYQEAVGDKNVDVFFDAYRIQEIPIFDSYSDINTIFSTLGENYLLGNASLDETMEEFERERRVIIEASKN